MLCFGIYMLKLEPDALHHVSRVQAQRLRDCVARGDDAQRLDQVRQGLGVGVGVDRDEGVVEVEALGGELRRQRLAVVQHVGRAVAEAPLLCLGTGGRDNDVFHLEQLGCDLGGYRAYPAARIDDDYGFGGFGRGGCSEGNMAAFDEGCGDFFSVDLFVFSIDIVYK